MKNLLLVLVLAAAQVAIAQDQGPRGETKKSEVLVAYNTIEKPLFDRLEEFQSKDILSSSVAFAKCAEYNSKKVEQPFAFQLDTLKGLSQFHSNVLFASFQAVRAELSKHGDTVAVDLNEFYREVQRVRSEHLTQSLRSCAMLLMGELKEAGDPEWTSGLVAKFDSRFLAPAQEVAKVIRESDNEAEKHMEEHYIGAFQYLLSKYIVKPDQEKPETKKPAVAPLVGPNGRRG